ISVLDPVAWNTRPYGADSRGYLDLGIGGPLMQGALSAGYRPIATDATSLSIWGQYDGDIYRRAAITWHDHTATAGANVTHRLNPNLAIGGRLYYTYGFHDMPGSWGRFSQGLSSLGLSAGVDGSYGSLSYKGAFGYSRFGFCNPHWSDSALAEMREVAPEATSKVSGTSQNLYPLDLDGSLQMGEKSYLGLGIDMSLLCTAAHSVPAIPYSDISQSDLGSIKRALVALHPSYSYRGEAVTATFGVEIDFAKNCGGAIKAAPEVTLAWHGLQYLAAEVRMHGGSTLNTLSSLYALTPYINPQMAYSRSHAPCVVDAKIAFGPFLGASVELFGGYAKANDWLMPVASTLMSAGGLTFDPLNVSGYRFGVGIGYDNGTTLSFSARWQHTPGEWKKAWLDCRDRARNVVSASLGVRPVSRLKIDVDYELRSGRSIYGYNPVPGELLGLTYYPVERRGLGVVSDLSLGATYTISRSFSAFVRAQNLLSRRSLELGDRPAQGFNALAGVALKF
ncbi:MAG: hypothetical protein K2K72_00550, partial [Duncaniella sp.]|nr:hypothetical protein [Duncaniella sp.]